MCESFCYGNIGKNSKSSDTKLYVYSPIPKKDGYGESKNVVCF